MNGKTVGVIGTGRIGRTVIGKLSGFGVDILAYDYKPDKEFEKSAKMKYTDLETLYGKADIITLHCPLTPDTQYMIDEKSINKMKKGVFIINTGRGKLIKTTALIDGLKNGRVGAAGLDVYEEESEYFFEDYSSTLISDDILARLLTFPNVLITSHQGFFTREALKNIAVTTFENIEEFFSGKILTKEICYRCGGECRKKRGGRCF
jgi:D-lactate dehydrogenase